MTKAHTRYLSSQRSAVIDRLAGPAVAWGQPTPWRYCHLHFEGSAYHPRDPERGEHHRNGRMHRTVDPVHGRGCHPRGVLRSSPHGQHLGDPRHPVRGGPNGPAGRLGDHHGCERANLQRRLDHRGHPVTTGGPRTLGGGEVSMPIQSLRRLGPSWAVGWSLVVNIAVICSLGCSQNNYRGPPAPEGWMTSCSDWCPGDLDCVDGRCTHECDAGGGDCYGVCTATCGPEGYCIPWECR